jgi:hypothetical protein
LILTTKPSKAQLVVLFRGIIPRHAPQHVQYHLVGGFNPSEEDVRQLESASHFSA